MDNDKLVEQMESQLQAALISLNSASEAADAARAAAHRLEARRAYESITNLLPRAALSGKRRVSFLTKLTEVRKQLEAAGETF